MSQHQTGARPSRLALYRTPEHPCHYLPERAARVLLAAPDGAMSAALYAQLVRQGFRRSGAHVYRPHCLHCAACVPIRLPVADFAWRRCHRRTLARNADLSVRQRPAGFDPEHFDLYCRYQRVRHPGGGMDRPTPGQYLDFLASPWADTRFIEFRRGPQLWMVAVVDCLSDGLSAVYTFYEPGEARRSLGSLAILWQVLECRRLALPYVYLGYWIHECAKMAYKARYTPHELLRDGHWQRVPATTHTTDTRQPPGYPLTMGTSTNPS